MGRHAGEKLAELYGKEARYGNWSDSFNENLEKQQVKASGVYDPDSDYAKMFESLPDETKLTNVDNDEFKSYMFEKPPRTAAEYRDEVQKLLAAGFDVRAQDMDPDKYKHANIGIRVGQNIAKGVDPEPTPAPAPAPAPGNAINAPTGTGYLSPTQQVTQANPVTNIASGEDSSIKSNVNNSVNQYTVDASNNSRFYEGSDTTNKVRYGDSRFYEGSDTTNKVRYGGKSFLADMGVGMNPYESTPIRVDADGTVRVANRPTDGLMGINNMNSLIGGNTKIGNIGSYNFYV